MTDTAQETMLCPAGFPVAPGTSQWELIPGPKGEKGERGEKGEKGTPLPASIRRAIVYLFVIALLISGANLYWTWHEVNASHAVQVREQVAQRAQGERTLRLLCTTFSELAANQPPPGNPATNPSRAYDLRQHDILDQLGTDLGCR